MVNYFTDWLRWLIASPSRFYALAALCAGFVMLFLTPPMQVPDEAAHFYRIYHLAEGGIFAKTQGGMTGSHLPSSLRNFKQKFDVLPFNPERKVAKGQYRKMLKQELYPHLREFHGFEVTALYSPIPYVPQVIGIWLGKSLNASPIVLMWLGRAFNLLFSVGIIVLAIRLMPAYRWVLVLVAMLPMALFQKASLSPDALTNAFAFLLTALVLRYTLTKVPVNFYALLAVVVLLAASKNAYIVLSLLLFLIPAEKYGGVKRYFAANTAIIGAGVLVAVSWILLVSDIYTPFSGRSNIDPPSQLEHILSNLGAFTTLLLNDLTSNAGKYISGLVGQLGWLDTPLPEWLVFFYVTSLVAVALLDSRCRTFIAWKGKVLLLVVGGLGVLTVITLLYLSAEPVGSRNIITVQGRYFIPLASVPLLLLYNVVTEHAWLQAPFLRWARARRGALVLIIVLISTSTTFFALGNRYYC